MGQKPASAADRQAYLDGPEGQALVSTAGAAIAAQQPLFNDEVRASYVVQAECSAGHKKQHAVHVKFLAAPAVVLKGAGPVDSGCAVLLAKCSRQYARARTKSFALEPVPGCDWELSLEYVRTSQSDTGQLPPLSHSTEALTSLLMPFAGSAGAAVGTVASIVDRVQAAATKHDTNPDIPYKKLDSLKSCGLSTIIWEREDGDFDVAHYADTEFECGYICPADAEKSCHTFRLPSNPVI